MPSLTSYPCSCCRFNSSSGVGDGRFMDIDIDVQDNFPYPGIPICGTCGGLGVEYDTEDFREKVARIFKLRFKFRPIDGLPMSPVIVPFVHLNNLLSEVEALTKKYGFGVPNSFARHILSPNSKYRQSLAMMKEEAERALGNIRSDPDMPPALDRIVIRSLIAFYSGDFEQGQNLYESAILKYPEDSKLYNDYGLLLISFMRDPYKALYYFTKSTTLNPKKALHFYQTFHVLYLLKKYEESLKYLRLSREQEDFWSFQSKNTFSVDHLENYLAGLVEGQVATIA